MNLEPHIQLDVDQQAVASVLQKLATTLNSQKKASKLSSWFNPKNKLKGIYIHGSVGRGKTMLMDAFYASLNLPHKQRWHFHEFMQQTHHKLKQIREDNSNEQQPIEILAKQIAQEAAVLCFDEFHVTDIADAMILGRLFGRLFDLGLIMVATSNQHPNELYANGLHRDRFLPFIEILRQHAPEMELDGTLDYRRQLLQEHQRYFTPATEKAQQQMEAIFNELSKGQKPQPYLLKHQGRSLQIPKAANGVARATFHDLCGQPLSSSDYLCLADNFHSLLLEDVPVIDSEDEAKRFITLIDILYDRNINLVISAQASPDKLYNAKKNKDLFKRTTSRLIEITGGV